eukprot:UN03861
MTTRGFLDQTTIHYENLKPLKITSGP